MHACMHVCLQLQSHSEPTIECSVCLNDMKVRYVGTCGHTFCMDCVVKSAKMTNSTFNKYRRQHGAAS